MQTKIELLSWTRFPIETVWCEWQRSRTDSYVPSPEEANKTQPMNEMMQVFADCIAMDLPVARCLSFTFAVDHMPIALREQLVRHMIGHHFDGRLGADLIPEQSHSSFWSQTMRAKDMGSFATNGEFYTPESITDKNCSVFGPRGPITQRDLYGRTMNDLQEIYNQLVASGVPLEDARLVMPLAVTHRLTWTVNMQAVGHILAKRGCWIAQLGMWKPVILGMVNELAEKVHPIFRTLIAPPCIDRRTDTYKSCPFSKENAEYIHGRDPHDPCPLWLQHEPKAAKQAWREAGDKARWIPGESPIQELNWVPALQRDSNNVARDNDAHIHKYMERVAEYDTLWQHDGYTWSKKCISMKRTPESELAFIQKYGGGQVAAQVKFRPVTTITEEELISEIAPATPVHYSAVHLTVVHLTTAQYNALPVYDLSLPTRPRPGFQWRTTNQSGGHEYRATILPDGKTIVWERIIRAPSDDSSKDATVPENMVSDGSTAYLRALKLVKCSHCLHIVKFDRKSGIDRVPCPSCKQTVLRDDPSAAT